MNTDNIPNGFFVDCRGVNITKALQGQGYNVHAQYCEGFTMDNQGNMVIQSTVIVRDEAYSENHFLYVMVENTYPKNEKRNVCHGKFLDALEELVIKTVKAHKEK